MTQPLRKRAANTPIPLYNPASIDREQQQPFKPKRKTPSNWVRRINWHYILVVSLVWYTTLYYFQRIKPRSAISKCHWDNWESFQQPNGQPHRVLLIADPQLVDDHTYPKRPRWIQYLTRKLSDNYMSVNYRLLQHRLKPHSTIFLGDLFDGGREWHDDAKWYDEWKRFNRIFPSYPHGRYYYNILGNHDAGWDRTMNKTLINRFKVIFGDSNDYSVIGNHTFLFLDTISLSATNNNDSSIYQEARFYLDNLTSVYLPQQDTAQRQKGQAPLPRVLLTHVPFFRNPNTQPCRGPREHKEPFPLMNGGTFQTVLWPDLTNELLNKLHPQVIFSGDDHDYCEIDHHYVAPDPLTNQNAQLQSREITVKSFSMNMGVDYPAAQLLSLYNPLDATEAALNPNPHTYQTKICFPFAPFTTLYAYAALLLLTIAHWALLAFYPATLRLIETRVHAVMDPVIVSLLRATPFLRFVFTNENSSTSTSTSSNGSYDLLSASDDDFDAKSSGLLQGRNLRNGGLVVFGVNFALQVVVIYTLFAYFHVNI